jgi:hypothetical protein
VLSFDVARVRWLCPSVAAGTGEIARPVPWRFEFGPLACTALSHEKVRIP